MTTRLAAAVLCMAFATTAAAQTVGGYARIAGDTVHFHRSYSVGIATELPRGFSSVFVGVEESIGLVLTGHGDSAMLWLDSLDVTSSSRTGRVHPSVDSVLHRPWILRFDARGRTHVLAGPPVPDSLARLVDLDADFNSLLPEVPLDPLTVGKTWDDTTVHRSGHHGTHVVTHQREHLQADRDTTVNGIPALVIGGVQEDSTVATAVTDGGPPAHVHLGGTAMVHFVFAPSVGRLLVYDLQGDAKGMLELNTGGGVKRYPQTYHERATIWAWGSSAADSLRASR